MLAQRPLGVLGDIAGNGGYPLPGASSYECRRQEDPRQGDPLGHIDMEDRHFPAQFSGNRDLNPTKGCPGKSHLFPSQIIQPPDL